MEVLDLYNADREKTGNTMIRGERTPDGLYRLVVHVCIFDTEGRMLIQQRQPFVRGWAGLWDVSIGGAAKAGDSSREAAVRETREELGIDLDLTGARPSLTICWENGYDDYYIVTKPVDLKALKLQPEEVQAARWADKDEVLRMIDDGRFIPYEKSLIELLFARRTNQSSHTRRDRTNV